MIDVKRAFRITTAYIKNVILFDPSNPETNLEEIIIIFAKLPRIRVGKLKSELYNLTSRPKSSFFKGLTKVKYIHIMPINLLNAKPIKEAILIKG